MVQTKMGRYWFQAKRWVPLEKICEWIKKNWVDIKTAEAGRKKDAKKYPKCVPLAKARRMTKRARRVGGKPTNVKTFARKKAFSGGIYG